MQKGSGFSPQVFKLEQILFKSAIPIISPSTCTMGNNGAFTLMTAHNTIYSGGAWVLWPIHSISASVPAAATFYWTVFSSTSAGTVYNNIMPATGFPTPPTSNTAFVSTGPGSVPGNTAATALLTFTVPAGVMGANGRLHIFTSTNYTNSAGTKVWTIKSGATTIATATNTTSLADNSTIRFANAGAQNINKSTNSPPGTTAVIYTAVDTSVAQTFTINITNNTATDNFVLDDVLVELLSDGT